MKIFYKQSNSEQNNPYNSLEVANVFLKKLSVKSDSFSVAKKFHHHTGFEIHMVTNGMQTYEIGGKSYTAKAGEMVIIPPNFKHRLIDTELLSEKYSVAFFCTNHQSETVSPKSIKFPYRLIENFNTIETEQQRNLQNSVKIIENCVFEILVNLLRAAGFAEEEVVKEEHLENALLVIAKQYIKDNIELSPTVNEVAKYCGISAKQLTRLFAENGTTPHAYVQKTRIKLIQHLLADTDNSLKQISEQLNFNNEYYFNSFFKKYSGMPPGEYRAMHKS